jgi:hypothetical protein
VGRPSEELDQGQDDQEGQGEAEDGLAGGPAPEHQGQAGQGDGADAQGPLVGPTQTPTGLVRRPACSALPCSQAIAPARPWRVRTAVTDPPVRNAPAATTSASIRMVRSPRRMNRTMVS